jgi:hypothetical protein
MMMMMMTFPCCSMDCFYTLHLGSIAEEYISQRDEPDRYNMRCLRIGMSAEVESSVGYENKSY